MVRAWRTSVFENGPTTQRATEPRRARSWSAYPLHLRAVTPSLSHLPHSSSDAQPTLALAPPSWMSPDWAESTLTRSTTSEFPFPSPAQFDALNRVVAALPRGTDSWSTLDETCLRLGIDESFYPLFLKLTLERGRDWHQKWTAAKDSLQGRGYNLKQQVSVRDSAVRVERSRAKAGGFELLKAKVEQAGRSTKRDSPSTRTHQPHASHTHSHTHPERKDASHSPATQARTARPSSRPPVTREFLVKPRADYQSSSDDYAGVPSRFSAVKQKSHTQHPVAEPELRIPGHQASASRAAKRSSFPPPPTLPSFTLPSHVHSHSPHFHASPHASASRADSDDANLPSGHLQAVLESKADQFRRFSLLSQGWFAWQSVLQRLSSRQRDLDTVRARVLQRWALDKWQARTARVRELEAFGDEVGRAREKDLKRRVMVRWVEAVDSKRKREWEAAMREAWNVVRGRWRERVSRDCLEVSLLAVRCSVARWSN